MIKNIFFDLDGTLIDSFGDISDCAISAYRLVGIDITKKISRFFIGPSLPEIIKNLTPEISNDDSEKIVKEYRRLYDSSSYPKTKLFDGVSDLLKSLKEKNFSLFVITNKPKLACSRILERVKVIDLFDGIVTSDTVSGKNMDKAEMIHFLLQLKIEAKNTIMAGDGKLDILGAKNNQIVPVAVLWGYGSKEELSASEPDFIIDKPNDLLKVIAILNKN